MFVTKWGNCNRARKENWVKYMLANHAYFVHLHRKEPSPENVEAAFDKMTKEGLVCAKNTNWRPVDTSPRKSRFNRYEASVNSKCRVREPLRRDRNGKKVSA